MILLYKSAVSLAQSWKAVCTAGGRVVPGACLELLGGLADGLKGGLGPRVAALVRVDQQAQPHVALLNVHVLGAHLHSHDGVCIGFFGCAQVPAQRPTVSC